MNRSFIAACVLAAAAAPALSQSLKPGLWEFQNKMSGNPELEKAQADMQKAMANMPPEQRKMMQEMMAKQGVQMGQGPGGATTVRMCLTKEMAERNDVGSHGDRSDCKTTMSPRTGNTMKLAFTCTNPPSSGEGTYTFLGDSGYTMKMTSTTQVQGKPQTVNMEGSGRFVSADCGNVKPIQMPPR